MKYTKKDMKKLNIFILLSTLALTLNAQWTLHQFPLESGSRDYYIAITVDGVMSNLEVQDTTFCIELYIEMHNRKLVTSIKPLEYGRYPVLHAETIDYVMKIRLDNNSKKRMRLPIYINRYMMYEVKGRLSRLIRNNDSLEFHIKEKHGKYGLEYKFTVDCKGVDDLINNYIL